MRHFMFCKKLLLAFASCGIAFSCSEKEDDLLFVDTSGSVSFTASMKTLARATDTGFEEGDKIGVYAVKLQEGTSASLLPSGNYAENIPYTYESGIFVNKDGIIHSEDAEFLYFAIYPYTTGCGSTFQFQVKENQHEAGQYTLSDLCTAVSEATKEKEVNLLFSHRLSHIIVNLEGEALGTGNPSVKLNEVSIGCSVDLNANTYTADDTHSTVYLADNGTNSFKAIVVPQTIEKEDTFLTVTLNNKEYILKAATDIHLASGKQHVFNLTITKDLKIISYTGEILPWEDAEEEMEKEAKVYIAGMFDSLWDGYVPCVWLEGEMRPLGIYNHDDGITYGCVTSLAVLDNDVYVGGWTTPPLSSEAGAYAEYATIWKNGAFFRGGWGYGGYFDEVNQIGYAYVLDMVSSGNDVVAAVSGDRIWKNGEIQSFSYSSKTIGSPQDVFLSDGNLYVMCTKYSNGKKYNYFWKNEELLDYEIEGEALHFFVQNENIYCLIIKDYELYLWKDGEMTATGLKHSTNYQLGPNFKTMFVDGGDVYILGKQDGVAKIWKNGEISLLTTEENKNDLTGIYVHNKDVYVIGYEYKGTEDYQQYNIVKLWKNGEETILPNGYSLAYPCCIVVTDAE